MLAGTLGDHAIDSAEMFALATAAGDALADTNRIAEAVAIFRRALEYDQSSTELLQRVDDLLAEQGQPEERLALYRSALTEATDPERRRRLLHRTARLQHSELQDVEGAVDTWKTALVDDATDLEAHEGLVLALEAIGDLNGLYKELDRSLAHVEGERRNTTLQRMAEVSSERGDATRALAHYAELLPSAELPDAVLDTVEQLSEKENSPETIRLVLLARVRKAVEPTYQAMWLERLGELQTERLRDRAGAVDSWKTAARLCDPADGAEAESRMQRLYQRVLGADADDNEAAEKLTESYARAGRWDELEAPYGALLRSSSDNERPVGLLRDLEPRMLETGALAQFVALADAAIERYADSDSRSSVEAMSAKARALAQDPAHHDEAASAYRAAIERHGEEEPGLVDAFRAMLGAAEPTETRVEDRRWLFNWRAEHAENPEAILLEWAAAEESAFENAKGALDLYSRVLEKSPEHTDCLMQVARLRGVLGDAEGALDALEQLRDRTEGEAKSDVELKIAAILLDSLDRPDKALTMVESVFEATPTNADALRIVQSALMHPSSRDRATEMLEKACDAAKSPEQGMEILETLLEVSAGRDELAESRIGWYHRLIDYRRSDPLVALNIAVQGAREHPTDDALWQDAEQFARAVEQPEPVATTQKALLEDDLDAELAEKIGERAVEFHEEWFDDTEAVVSLLERVLELAPRADWAQDRLKLAFNAAGRWDDLFRLYDRAIEHAPDDDARVSLLEEAALAAKDFASDAAKAIDYLEKQRELRPGDSRVESSLERLYEREGRTLPLIELLSNQLGGLKGRKLQGMRARIARLWLDVGDEEKSFELGEAIWKDEPAKKEAIEILEGIIQRAVPAASLPPAGKGRRRRKVLRARDRAAALLKDHYAEEGRTADVVRMLEVELEAATTTNERVERLERIVSLRVDDLGDHAGAFDSVALLVSLQPEVDAHRERLVSLAEKVDAHDRYAALLVNVAGEVTKKPALRARLLSDSANVYQNTLADSEKAIELYLQVLDLAEDEPAAALAAARALDPLLVDAAQPDTRCTVLEKLAALDDQLESRQRVLAEVARVAREELSDPERAVAAWRSRLADDAKDIDALDGLVSVLESVDRTADLVEALDARAKAARSDEDARADRVRRARLYADQLNDRSAAIDAWLAIRADFGADQESFGALMGLLEAEQRWEDLAALLSEEAEAARDEERSALKTLLGDVHRDHTGHVERALEAYAEAQSWERATELARAVDDRELAETIARRLFALSGARWAKTEADVESDVAQAATWAVDRLGSRWLSDGEHSRAADLFIEAAELPFPIERRRDLRREAACIAADRLGDSERAIDLFRALLAEDPSDDVAATAAPRLAPLLTEAGLHEEVVSVWETQGRCRTEKGAIPAATELWLRAAELAEQELADVDRAVRSYRQAAALKSEAALEALARIHLDRGERKAEADALEWLCDQSSSEEIAERSLRLAEAYVVIGQPELARARLELAVERGRETGAARARLAELYRDGERWAPLSNLLAADAELAPEKADQLSLLREAASIQMEKLNDPAAAAQLLRRTVEIDPEDEQNRFALADALTAAEAYEDAASILREQIGRYGARKPKGRALVHHRLAQVLTAASDHEGALTELEVAAKIDQAHPRILRALAQAALSAGQLDRSESTYRALLLVLRRTTDAEPDAPSRAEAFIDLSEIAAKREDSVRATEFIESAFEAALEDSREAARLERALRVRGRHELLARAIEARLDDADPRQAARALADLAMLHAEGIASEEEAEDRFRTRAEEILKDLEDDGNADDGAWLALGRVYDWLGDEESEARILEQCIGGRADGGEGIDDPELLYRLAELRLKNERTRNKGLSALEKALEAKADVPRAEAMLKAAAEQDPLNEGVARLLESISRTPGRERALLDALVLLASRPGAETDTVRECVYLGHSLGESSMAVSVLKLAVERDTQSSDAEYSAWARLTLADFIAEDDLAEACALREQAASFVPEDRARDILMDVARALDTEVGDASRAASIYAEMLKQAPTDREILEPLMVLYRKLDDSKSLVTLIQRTLPTLENLEDRTRMRLELATVLLQDDDRTDDAAAVLREILDEDPSHLGATGLLAGILERRERFDELAVLLRTQLDTAKDREDVDSIAAISVRLGALLEQQNERDEALDVYRGALEWSPRAKEALRAVVRLIDENEDSFELCETLEKLVEAEEAEDAEPHAQRLLKLRKEQGDDEGIERALEIGVTACPNSLELREELVHRYVERGDFGKAAQVLERAFEANPNDRGLLTALIEAYRSGGDYEPAIEAVGKAMQQSPDDAELVHMRALLLEGMGFEDDALLEMQRAFDLNANYATDYEGALVRAIERGDDEERRQLTLQLVDVLERTGQSHLARGYLEQLLEETPSSKRILRRLAQLHVGAGALGDAVETYRRLLEIVDAATLPEVALEYADVCESAEHPAEASVPLERALAAQPDHPELRQRLRAIYQASGAHRALAAMLVQDASAEPDDTARYGLLVDAGRLLLEPGGDAGEAIAVLEQARAYPTADDEIALLLGRAYSAGGRPADAIATLNAVIEAHGNRRSRELAPLHAQIAAIYLGQGSQQEAFGYLNRAFEMNPKNGSLAMQLAELAQALGDDDAALRAYRSVTMMKVVDDGGADGTTVKAKAMAYYQLGRRAHESGEVRKAKMLVTKALHEDPEHELARQLRDVLQAG